MAGFAAMALAVVGLAAVASHGQFPKYPPAIVRAPDVNAQNDINEQNNKQQKFEAANAERKRQINDDSAKLFKLATELKAEVDKTDKDTLSIGVIRKADAIEKLAHDLKEKMKLTVGAN
jgi:ribosomal protein L9